MRDANETGESLQARGRSPYLLWLIWVLWLPLITPAFLKFFQAHPIVPRLLATLLGSVLFFAVYLWASWNRARRLATPSPPKYSEALTWLAIVVLTVLCLALTILGGNEWQALFFYTSGYVGGTLPLRRAIVASSVLTLLATLAGWLAGLSWLDLLQGVVFIPTIVFITKSVIWSITTSWELSAAREEIARLAVTTERLRIARDLHDLLGHNLSLIALKSELAGRLLGVKPERAASEIGDVESIARTTLQEVRDAVAGYRQPTLANELHAAQEILAAAGIVYKYESDENSMATLPPSIEAILSWTVREGVTNVIRHSRAHQCRICVTRDTQNARVEVTDDGVASTEETGNGGNGLRGLAERVAGLGGQFEARPRANDGFRLAVSVPLAGRKHDLAAPTTSTNSRSQPVLAASPERTYSYEERSTQV